MALVTSQAVIELIKYLIDRHDKRKQTPERMMLKALGADRLGVLLRDWMHSDIRTAGDWKIIEDLYAGYRALEGNGEIKKLYDEAKTIPTTE
jgi:hypothetical protein